MQIYIVFSNYFDTGVFGVYSSIKRAKLAIEKFAANDENIATFDEEDDYTYVFTDRFDRSFTAEIAWDILDYEFEEGSIKEDNNG